MTTPNWIAVLGLPIMLLADCATDRKPDFRPVAPSASESVSEQGGLRITLAPFVDVEGAKKYFGIKGIPVPDVGRAQVTPPFVLDKPSRKNLKDCP
jgi:hypothetical protein